VEGVDCLVIGHYEVRLEGVAPRLRPNRDHLGAFSLVIRAISSVCAPPTAVPRSFVGLNQCFVAGVAI
jgi:hypothetical protein